MDTGGVFEKKGEFDIVDGFVSSVLVSPLSDACSSLVNSFII